MRLVQWAEKACRSALLEKTPYNHNLIQILTRSGLPLKTSLSEAKENLGPGTDTTSATLAHIIWALSHNLQFQERLFQDLQGKNFSSDLSDLEAVPRLRACVKEGIRWTGAAAVMLPRLVPQGGIELDGKFIPEGVSVFQFHNIHPIGVNDSQTLRSFSLLLPFGILETLSHFQIPRTLIHIDGSLRTGWRSARTNSEINSIYRSPKVEIRVLERSESFFSGRSKYRAITNDPVFRITNFTSPCHNS